MTIATLADERSLHRVDDQIEPFVAHAVICAGSIVMFAPPHSPSGRFQ
jgi:hypothetical protein